MKCMDLQHLRRSHHLEHRCSSSRSNCGYGGRCSPWKSPKIAPRFTLWRKGASYHNVGSRDVVTTTPRVASASSNPESGGPVDSTVQKSKSSEDTTDGSSTGADDKAENQNNAGAFASVGILGGIVLLALAGYLGRDQIKAFLEFFITAVDEWGPWGYVAYAAVYAGLEVLAVPAIPLTMTAGVIFGPVVGTGIVALSATTAATIAFLLARYALRDKVLQFAKQNQNFAAIDKAIGKDGLKFVFLLRLSPLLPLAASNYLYGLTSVDLPAYIIGSFFGMIPGTYAYVTTGHLGKSVLMDGHGSIGVESWQLALGAATTILALGFVGHLAKQAIEGVEKEQEQGKQ